LSKWTSNISTTDQPLVGCDCAMCCFTQSRGWGAALPPYGMEAPQPGWGTYSWGLTACSSTTTAIAWIALHWLLHLDFCWETTICRFLSTKWKHNTWQQQG
jgi:hypothetical protein